MSTVKVLLSSYNGERYIEEQINTILKQKKVDIQLYIRDDGSNDKTREIVNSLLKTNKGAIKVFYGENIGYIKSFYWLLENAGEAEYYAFSDQDDIWLDNKLISAINMIEKVGSEKIPICYHGWKKLVDEDLKEIYNSNKPRFPKNKYMSLYQNQAQGATMVINKALKEKIVGVDIPYRVAHDIWIPIVSEYIGRLIFDPNEYMLYRRHNNTVTDNTLDKKKYYKRLIKRLLNGEELPNIPRYLLRGYKDDLQEDDKKKLIELSSVNTLDGRIRVVFDKDVRKHTLRGTLLLKAAILFGRISCE